MSIPALRFALVLLCGFLVAASIGKLVPHVTWMAERYGVSLGLAGFAVSAVMLPGAVLSVWMGTVSDRLGAKAVTIAGLAVGAAASLALGLVGQFWTLVALRLAEGVGYSVAVVAATVLVMEVSGARHRVLALAVWSSFAPVGFALGQWAAATAAGPERLVEIGLWHGMLLAGAAALLALLVPGKAGTPQTGRRAAPLIEAFGHPPSLLASLSFGCAVGVLLSAVTVTPLVLASLNELPVTEAARLTALAALPGIVGRFVAGWLLGARLTPLAVLAAASGTGLLAVGTSLIAPLPLVLALLLFTLFQIATGILPGVLSAMIPHVAPSPDKLGTVSGLVNQMVTLGNLIGPPLVLTLYAWGGVAAAVTMLAAWSCLCVGLVARLAVFRRSVPA